MITLYCIPECSERWTEAQARDYAAGVAVPCDPCDEPSDTEKSLRRAKDSFVKAYHENPLLPRSRYLDPLNGKVLWQ